MQREFTLNDKENKLVVRVSNAELIEIFNADNNCVARVKSPKILAPQVFFLEPGQYKVETDGIIEDLKAEYENVELFNEPGHLLVKSDAKDIHVVDGIGEIPADGKSFATITIKKMNADCNPMSSAKDKDEVYLRTTAGTIKDVEGESEIRKIQLVKGQAQFRLYSEEHKRVATVEIVSANPMLMNSSIKIEFF